MDLSSFHIIQVLPLYRRKVLIRIVVRNPDVPALDDVIADLDGNLGIPLHSGIDFDF